MKKGGEKGLFLRKEDLINISAKNKYSYADNPYGPGRRSLNGFPRKVPGIRGTRAGRKKNAQ